MRKEEKRRRGEREMGGIVLKCCETMMAGGRIMKNGRLGN